MVPNPAMSATQTTLKKTSKIHCQNEMAITIPSSLKYEINYLATYSGEV